jgi:aryl-alcohol dehydrogenase-like predicted oxidoreductase
MPLRVADAVAVLDELGIERAHFIGNSWGGRLCFGIGEHAPERVLSLVIGGQQPYAIDPDGPLAHAATETLAESRREGSMEPFVAMLESFAGARFPDTLGERWLDNDPAAIEAAWSAAIAEGAISEDLGAWHVRCACFGYVSGELFGDLGMTEEASFRLMDLALERGINFFDTADVYGWDQGIGLSEGVIGRWFAQGGGRREKVVLATKVFHASSPVWPHETWPNQKGLSALHIRRACEDSLRRLGTDYIDLYQMHYVDRATPWEEIWQAMEQLVREGKVLYVGSSNFAGWHIAQANDVARARNLLGLVVEQCGYSLSSRNVEMEVLPACEAYGMGVVAYEPLAEGVLAGAFGKAEEGYRSTKRVREIVERHRAALEAYEGLCRELGEPPVAVALAWLLSRPG